MVDGEMLQCCKITMVKLNPGVSKKYVWPVLVYNYEQGDNVIVSGFMSNFFCVNKKDFASAMLRVDSSEDFYFKVIGPVDEYFLAPVMSFKLSDLIFQVKKR